MRSHTGRPNVYNEYGPFQPPPTSSSWLRPSAWPATGAASKCTSSTILARSTAAVWRCGAGSPACSITRYGSCGSAPRRRSGGFRRYGCAGGHGWVRDKLQNGDLTLTAAAQLETAIAGAERHGKQAVARRGGAQPAGNGRPPGGRGLVGGGQNVPAGIAGAAPAAATGAATAGIADAAPAATGAAVTELAGAAAAATGAAGSRNGGCCASGGDQRGGGRAGGGGGRGSSMRATGCAGGRGCAPCRGG